MNGARRTMPRQTMADWLDEPDDASEDAWVVARAIMAGALTLLVGASESFKSWAALGLIPSPLTGAHLPGGDEVLHVANHHGNDGERL